MLAVHINRTLKCGLLLRCNSVLSVLSAFRVRLGSCRPPMCVLTTPGVFSGIGNVLKRATVAGKRTLNGLTNFGLT